MTKRDVLLISVFVFIALGAAIWWGQNNSTTVDLTYVNNHTGAKVQVLTIEEVTVSESPQVINQVVVYIFLSGQVDVLQGEQRREIHDFARHYHKFELELIQTTSPNSTTSGVGLFHFS